MGKVDVDVRGILHVQLQSPEDVAALRAALRCVPGTDPCEPSAERRIALDPENPSNLLALYGAGFEWTHAALVRALDELVPYAAANVSMHASTRNKMFTRMVAQAQAAKAGPAQSADATTSPPSPQPPPSAL